MEVHVCEHCHNYIGNSSARFCGECNTAEKRKIMDQANKKHFAEKGLDYKCHHCKETK
jgi:hypothetical protein